MANGVWTNNWQALKNTMLLAGIYPGLNSIIDISGTAVSASTNTYLASPPLGPVFTSGNNNNTSFSIRLGTGTNPAAASDYTLAESANVNYLSTGSSIATFDDVTGTMSRTYTVTAQYVGAGTITLTEWGIYGKVWYRAANTNYAQAMVYRELFDTPIVLTQYQAAALEVNLSMVMSHPV